MNLIWRILQVWPLGLVPVSDFAHLFQGIAGVGVIISVIAQEIVKIPKKTTQETDNTISDAG